MMDTAAQHVSIQKGEGFELRFIVPIPTGVAFADFAPLKFVAGSLTILAGSISLEDQGANVLVGVPVDEADLAAFVPGTYLFELALDVAGDSIVAAHGTFAVNESLALA